MSKSSGSAHKAGEGRALASGEPGERLERKQYQMGEPMRAAQHS